MRVDILFIIVIVGFFGGALLMVWAERYGRRRMCVESMMFVPGSQMWVRVVTSHATFDRLAQERAIEEEADWHNVVHQFVPPRQCECPICGEIHDDRRYK